MQTHDFFLILLVILLTARIFAEFGRESGILNSEIYAGMVIVIAVTTVLSPFAMKELYSRFNDHMLPSNST